MNYATLCSGIGAPELALDKIGGWTCAFHSEIEPFPSAVLAARWPDVPNYGDMNGWRDWPKHNLDLLVAGTPCQAFSVAGARGGLDDARGNLTLEFARYANAVRPRYILWENVPGVLSDKSNAFGCLLAALAGSHSSIVYPGKRWPDTGFVSGPKRQICWRVCDAQFFGVPQRRRRVFLLASDVERGVGNWASARVLFPDRESAGWHPVTGTTAREEVAAHAGGGAGCFWNGEQVTQTLDAAGLSKGQMMPEKNRFPAVIVPGKSHWVVAVHGVDNENNAFVDVCGPVIAGRSGGGGRPLPAVMVPEVTGWTIRRLLPVETEKLQGMPPGHTRIPKRVHATKPHSKHFAKYPHYYDEQPDGAWIQHHADGPRYKAIGNSMAVPCVEFILRNLTGLITC